MTTTYGVTLSGFVRKHLADVVLDLQNAFKTAFGVDKRVDAKSPEGVIIGLVAAPISEVWELLEAVYNAFVPSSAEGVALDGCLDINGLSRLPASPSTVSVILGGSLPITIPKGAIVKTSPGDAQFQTKREETITWSSVCRAVGTIAASPAGGTVFTITVDGVDYSRTVVGGDSALVTAGYLELLIEAGASDVSVTAASSGSDATVTILGNGTVPASFSVAFGTAFTSYEAGQSCEMESVETGEIQANAGTLTSIVTNVANWSMATNPLDASLGSTGETDPEARQRRARSVANPGATTLEAITAKLLAVQGATHVNVLQNVTDATVDTIPPHSIEAIILGGSSADIAEVMWAQGGAGIYQSGSTSYSITDSQGITQTVRFTRPTEKKMWIRATVTDFTEEEMPDNPTAAIKEGVLSFGEDFEPGADVMPHRFFGPINDACPGIRSLTVEVAEDVAGSPGAYQSTAWSIGARVYASFSTDRITVVGP